MWKSAEKSPIVEFLGWLLLLWAFVTTMNFILEPYSVEYIESGRITAGYVLYAIIGFFVDTPTPMIATIIVLIHHKKISSIKDFFKLVIYTGSLKKSILITGIFCAAALCAAVIFGIPTGAPWYLMFAALPLMIIGGGVEEIGWRGFLQPALEKKFPFPIATLLVAIIVYIWHLTLWFLPSSNHYGDSLTGFAIMIFVWAFIGAAIYKATKSVFSCVVYHAFINTIGAVYDWNALFDKFPNESGMYIYFTAVFILSICIWVFADKNIGRGEKVGWKPA